MCKGQHGEGAVVAAGTSAKTQSSEHAHRMEQVARQRV